MLLSRLTFFSWRDPMLLDVQDTLTIFHPTDEIRLLILDHWSSLLFCTRTFTIRIKTWTCETVTVSALLWVVPILLIWNLHDLLSCTVWSILFPAVGYALLPAVGCALLLSWVPGSFPWLFFRLSPSMPALPVRDIGAAVPAGTAHIVVRPCFQGLPDQTSLSSSLRSCTVALLCHRGLLVHDSNLLLAVVCRTSATSDSISTVVTAFAWPCASWSAGTSRPIPHCLIDWPVSRNKWSFLYLCSSVDPGAAARGHQTHNAHVLLPASTVVVRPLWRRVFLFLHVGSCSHFILNSLKIFTIVLSFRRRESLFTRRWVTHCSWCDVLLPHLWCTPATSSWLTRDNSLLHRSFIGVFQLFPVSAVLSRRSLFVSIQTRNSVGALFSCSLHHWACSEPDCGASSPVAERYVLHWPPTCADLHRWSDATENHGFWQLLMAPLPCRQAPFLRYHHLFRSSTLLILLLVFWTGWAFTTAVSLMIRQSLCLETSRLHLTTRCRSRSTLALLQRWTCILLFLSPSGQTWQKKCPTPDWLTKV